ncbi:MAG: trehalose-phosphatase [Enhydrobacter sp.]|nr:MAG: trehalose-phosphatase [Enhydrobacter sp.]
MAPPDFDRTSALFLDVDGTLLEIAETPENVVVPADLPELLTQLRDHLGGALAIVSGRPIAQIDRLFDPFCSSAAGEHGAALRFDDGTREEMPAVASVPDSWRVALAAAADRWPGVRLEPKPHGVTIHYRLAPDRGNEVWQVARSLVPENDPWFRLLPAREAVEIGLRGSSKGSAVQRLMRQPAFRGRKPIFIGDDFTDEAGMSAARELGGIGLRVADDFDGDPAQVRAWLMRGAERLASMRPATHSDGASP